ncbi:hypothetical protein [Massilia oculi]|uniref:hypothetical protein n=1 Tax=Massilia oculi TaxID=945844 RepID=UPI001AAFE0A5|nr:hypothetical protein [Massilia oculi]
MKKLPPLVDGVDGRHLKLRGIEGVDYDFLGYMLSCHLVIEHYLAEFLSTLGTELFWDKARLTFTQKISLFPCALFPNGAELVEAIKHLNSIRNKVAHDIRVRPQDLSYDPLKNYLRSVFRNQEPVPNEPREILEKFTSIACSGLAGWIASDAYRTNWRQNRQAQQDIHAGTPKE